MPAGSVRAAGQRNRSNCKFASSAKKSRPWRRPVAVAPCHCRSKPVGRNCRSSRRARRSDSPRRSIDNPRCKLTSTGPLISRLKFVPAASNPTKLAVPIARKPARGPLIWPVKFARPANRGRSRNASRTPAGIRLGTKPGRGSKLTFCTATCKSRWRRVGKPASCGGMLGNKDPSARNPGPTARSSRIACPSQRAAKSIGSRWLR